MEKTSVQTASSLARLPESVREEVAGSLSANRTQIVEQWWQSQFNAELLKRYEVAAINEHQPVVLKQRFLAPLLQLLIAYIRHGDEDIATVYLDERMRYAPHRQSPEVRAAFFAELLPADEACLLKSVPAGSAPVLKEILKELHIPLLSVPEKPLRVLGIGDFMMNELRARLPRAALSAGLQLDFRCFYVEEHLGTSLSANEEIRCIERFRPEVIAISLLTYKPLQLYAMLLKEAEHLGQRETENRSRLLLSQIHNFIAELRSKTDAPFILHNASGLPLTTLRKHFPFMPPLSAGRKRLLEALNQGVLEMTRSIPKVTLIDEQGLAEAAGVRKCARPLISRSICHNSFFEHTEFGRVLVEPYIDLLMSYRLLGQAKVILVDFDNTLWQGVMADGPVVQRKTMQQSLLKLKESGILLVAVTKNDPANIRWDEMELKPHDFVLQKINWNTKAQSVKEAAAELSLGEDSFVLLDDNPTERALVRRECPAVKVLDSTLPQAEVWLQRMLSFPNTRDTEEARARTEMYRKQAERRAALSAAFDYPAMMASLDLAARFGPAGDADADRITELCQRTNQFNTTTKRYQRNEIAAFLNSPNHGVYVTELSDKFGSVGLVGVVIVERKGPARVIDSFIMSCRAMGFELEKLMLVLSLYSEGREVRHCKGLFYQTDKNKPASTLFEKCGFQKKNDQEWELDLSKQEVSLNRSDTPLSPPSWFTVLSRA